MGWVPPVYDQLIMNVRSSYASSSPRRAAALALRPEGDATLREHLVEAVDEFLEHESIHGLTTRTIAHHAGVADGALYNHFDDKAELVVAALVRRFGRLVARLEASVPTAGKGSVTANVQGFARSLVHLNAEAIGTGAGLLADPALLHRFWAEIHREPFGIERLRRPLADYLDAERAQGRIVDDADVDALVTLVFGACVLGGLSEHLGAHAHQPAGHAHLDAAIETALRGIATDGAGPESFATQG